MAEKLRKKGKRKRQNELQDESSTWLATLRRTAPVHTSQSFQRQRKPTHKHVPKPQLLIPGEGHLIFFSPVPSAPCVTYVFRAHCEHRTQAASQFPDAAATTNPMNHPRGLASRFTSPGTLRAATSPSAWTTRNSNTKQTRGFSLALLWSLCGIIPRARVRADDIYSGPTWL